MPAPALVLSSRQAPRRGRGRAGGAAIYACICFGINERAVRDHIRAGATTLAALAETCAAGSDCGGCQERLLRLIAEERNDAADGRAG